jgi:hypothetical protein
MANEEGGTCQIVQNGQRLEPMDQATRELLARTESPLRPNGERKLAHNLFMQVTWGLLGAAALTQLFLLVWLDVMS